MSGIGRFAARGLATRKNLAAAGVVGTTGVAAANELIGPVGAEVTPLGGDLPGVAAPESPLDEFLARFDTDAAGAAGGEAPQAGAPEGDFDLEGLYGAYSPAVNELLGLENDHWDRVIEQGRDYYEDVTARATQAFDAATTDREKAHWQARLLDAERQYQAGLAQVAQQRHIGLTNVRQYGVQLADHEQAQAASAAQQGIENEQAQRQGNFESFQQGLELHGPALSAAAGQAMSEQFSAALGPETVAALGPSALAVQEASNVALAGDTEGAMAVIGAEVQRLRAAATPETDLAAATLNQLLTAALQSSQAVQQGGLAFLMEQSGVAPGG